MEVMTESSADRRRRARIPVSVELKLHAPDLHFVLLSRTIDMSTQGAFVRSNRPLPVGASVTHPLFGSGFITERVGEGKSLKLTIDFAEHGQKKILPSYTKLRVYT